MKLEAGSHDAKHMSSIVAGAVADSSELMHLPTNQIHTRHERQKKI